jgi:hypothetical protein
MLLPTGDGSAPSVVVIVLPGDGRVRRFRIVTQGAGPPGIVRQKRYDSATNRSRCDGDGVLIRGRERCSPIPYAPVQRLNLRGFRFLQVRGRAFRALNSQQPYAAAVSRHVGRPALGQVTYHMTSMGQRCCAGVHVTTIPPFSLT